MSALDRTSCRMSGSSRANIVADAMETMNAPTEGHSIQGIVTVAPVNPSVSPVGGQTEEEGQ